LTGGVPVITLTGNAQAGACVVVLTPALNANNITWTFTNTAPCNRAQTGVGT